MSPLPEDKERMEARQRHIDYLLSAEYRGRPIDEQVNIPNAAELAKMAWFEVQLGFRFFGASILKDESRRDIVREALNKKLADHYGQARHFLELVMGRAIEVFAPHHDYDNTHFVQSIPNQHARADFVTQGIDDALSDQLWSERGRNLTVDEIVESAGAARSGVVRETVRQRFQKFRADLAAGRRGTRHFLTDRTLNMFGHAYSQPNFTALSRDPTTAIRHLGAIPGRAFVRMKTYDTDYNTFWNKIAREANEVMSKRGINHPKPELAIELFKTIRVNDIAAANFILYVPPREVEARVRDLVKFIKTDTAISQFYPWPGSGRSPAIPSTFETNDYVSRTRPQPRYKLVMATEGLIPPDSSTFGFSSDSKLRMEAVITDITSELLYNLTGEHSHERFEHDRNRYWTDSNGKKHAFTGRQVKQNEHALTDFIL